MLCRKTIVSPVLLQVVQIDAYVSLFLSRCVKNYASNIQAHRRLVFREAGSKPPAPGKKSTRSQGLIERETSAE